MSEILKLENINYSYIDGGYERQILQDLCFTFESGKFYTVLGPSGSGKTTLLSLVAGLDEAKSGNIYYNGKDIAKEMGNKENKQHINRTKPHWWERGYKNQVFFCIFNQSSNIFSPTLPLFSG